MDTALHLMLLNGSTAAAAPAPSGDAMQTLLESLADGEWSRVGPNTTAQPNSLNDVQAARTKAVFDVGGAGGSVFTNDAEVVTVCKSMFPSGFIAWNGCAVGTGARAGKVWYWGAGHADGAGNQVFEMDLNAATPVWAAITDQNPLGDTAHASYPVLPSAGVQPYFFHPTQSGQEDLQPVGSLGPPAAHSYDLLHYDETNDRLWVIPAAIFQQSGTGDGIWYLNLASGEWVLHHNGDSDGTVPDLTSGGLFAAPDFDGSNLFWQAGSSGVVVRYNIAAKSQTNAAVFWSGSGVSQAPRFVIPNRDSVAGEYDMVGWHATNGNLTIFPQIIAGMGGIPNRSYAVSTYNGDARQYVANSAARIRTVDGKAYAMIGPTGAIQTIEFTGAKTEVTVADITTSGNPALTMTNGILGKWNYLPDYDAFVAVIGSTTAEVWLWRPPNWAMPA